MFDVMFAENVSIESLNPHNFAMKNEYIDNLISTAWLIIPKVALDKENLKVVKGFLSEAFMRAQDYKLESVEYILQHARGLALELTWDAFTVEDATEVGLRLVNECLEPLYVIVYPSRKKIGVYRKYLDDKSMLSQIVDGIVRVVKTVTI